VLLRQDDARARARLAEANASLDQVEARLAELVRGPRAEQVSAASANVDGAKKELAFRRADHTRVKEIFAKKLASAEVMDRAKAQLDSATANVDLRVAQLEELLAGTTVEELAQAESAVKQAEARRDSAEIDVERHTLRAPTAAVVDSRLYEMGERPSAGQVVLVLLGGEQPYARVYVPESLRVMIKPGTRANIFVDGLNDAIEGKVRWVASESAFTPYFALTERDRGRLSFLAKVDIAEQRARLPDGVPVEVEFNLGGVNE
jgi:HlyD family secretion protein